MQLLSLVKDFDIITIFRHQIADHDALGSQFAMKEYLKTVFPEKEVYALGKSVGPAAKLFPDIDEIEDEPTHTYFNHYRNVNAFIDAMLLQAGLFLQK